MSISLFDTHADTPYASYKAGEDLISNSLHISLEKAAAFENYCQCMAIWSDKALSDDDAYRQFNTVYDHFTYQAEKTGAACICRSYEEIEAAVSLNKRAFILTVEDARLLNNYIDRIDDLCNKGVKILTFQWQGETCIGGGFDTEKGLSKFGSIVAQKCADGNIIPDISHANERTARDIIEVLSKYNKPVIATHSNSYSVCPHKRNMTDSLFDALVSINGIVGISLAPQHLTMDGIASSEDVLRHIDHYVERHGIENVCLGCDLDGIETTPTDVRDISELTVLADKLEEHGYSRQDIDAVFYQNARNFFAKNLIRK